MRNPEKNKSPQFTLKLFVSGQTAKSQVALAELRDICVKKLAGHYSVEVHEVQDDPELVDMQFDLATKTVIEELPLSLQQALENLAEKENILIGLNIYTN